MLGSRSGYPASGKLFWRVILPGGRPRLESVWQAEVCEVRFLCSPLWIMNPEGRGAALKADGAERHGLRVLRYPQSGLWVKPNGTASSSGGRAIRKPSLGSCTRQGRAPFRKRLILERVWGSRPPASALHPLARRKDPLGGRSVLARADLLSKPRRSGIPTPRATGKDFGNESHRASKDL